jgi:predicted metal-dependent hydrolase
MAMNTSEDYLAFVEHFNARRYRACVEPLEQIWFAQRDDFHKALIRVCVGLNQIELGLDSGPRFLLQTARELLASYGTRHNGLDLDHLRAFLVRAEAVLDDEPPRTVPPFTIELQDARE